MNDQLIVSNISLKMKSFLGKIFAVRPKIMFHYNRYPQLRYPQMPSKFYEACKSGTTDEVHEEFLCIDDDYDSCDIYRKGLNVACDAFNKDAITYLLKNLFQPSYLIHSIMRACRMENVDLLKFLLNFNPDLLDTDTLSAALEEACNKGNLEISSLLILNFVDIDIRYHCNMPLIRACQTDNLELVKFLVAHGADATDDDVACCAADKGRLDILKFLFSCGSDIRSNAAVLQRACWSGHLHVVEFLLTIHGQYDYEEAMSLAVGCNFPEILKLLVEKDLASCNQAFVWGCQIGQLWAVKYLLETKQDDIEPRPDLILHADMNRYHEVVELLASYGWPTEDLSDWSKRYLALREKVKYRIRNQAAKKIYFWIIPILYSPDSESAYRLGLKGYEECFGSTQ